MATGGKCVSDENVNQTCSVCLGSPSSPKLLPCQHTFCEQCISEYIVTAERQARQKIVEFSCPVCRTVVTPSNPDQDSSEWAANLADIEKKSVPKDRSNSVQVGPKRQECDVCKRRHKTTTGSNWCRECQEIMCDACMEYHGIMKQSQHHNVIKVDLHLYEHFEIIGQNESDNCSVHNAKPCEVYCFDHKQLCCVTCLTHNHKDCEDVFDINELISDGDESLEKTLENAQEAAMALFEARKKEIASFEDSCKNIEQTLETSVKMAKDKLDALMILFRKELHLKQDEYLIDDQDIKHLEKFLQENEKALETVAQIRKYGTPLQIFRYLNKTKEETKESLSSLILNLEDLKQLDVELKLEDVFENMLLLEKVGHAEISQYESQSVMDFRNKISSLVKTQVSFENIKVTRNKTIRIEHSGLQCGVCIDDNTVVIGSSDSSLIAIDVTLGDTTCTINEKKMDIKPKRISYFKKGSHGGSLLLSGTYGIIATIQISNEHNFMCPVSICNFGTNGPYTGGIFVSDFNVYAIVGDTIQWFNADKTGKVERGTKTLKIHSYCSNCVNGLAVKNNQDLIYTSKDFSVVCITQDRQEVFQYKDDAMKKVTSLAVCSSGVIFAGDESGCVHVINEDGKQRKTLIQKCDKIKQVNDVWLDEKEKRLIVCGDNYVEVYNISN